SSILERDQMSWRVRARVGVLLATVAIEPASLAARQGRAPLTSFDVRAFGAKGDGRTLDTDGINKAIDAAAGAGGGTVYFGAGTYLSASIHLRSHVGLFIDHGATIEAVDHTVSPYDEPEALPQWDAFQDFGHSHWHNSLMWGENVEDVSITGPGVIHGKGLVRSTTNGVAPRGSGNKAIALRNSRNVLIRDVTIFHGGWFAIL